MMKIKLNKIFSRLSKDIAIDLGTTNSLVYVRGQGIVVAEPSVVAINKKTGQILAVGNEAREMVGRTPGYITATRPLINGAVSDFEITEQMLKYFVNRVYQNRVVFNPWLRAIIGIPCDATEVEKKAVIDAAKSAGAKEVYLIEEPMAAAIGAHLPVRDSGGNFVVDIGGGTTDIAVISLGGLVVSKSLSVAGNKLNEDIVHFCQEEYNLLIGERTAEDVKIKIGSAFPLNSNKKLSNRKKSEKKEVAIRGRNLVTGLPEEIMISDEDIRLAMEQSINKIVEAIKGVIEQTPPELLSDVMSRGIYLLGGGALLRGLDILIAKETKIPTKVINDPLTAVVRGGGVVIENIDKLKEVLAEIGNLEPPK